MRLVIYSCDNISVACVGSFHTWNVPGNKHDIDEITYSTTKLQAGVREGKMRTLEKIRIQFRRNFGKTTHQASIIPFFFFFSSIGFLLPPKTSAYSFRSRVQRPRRVRLACAKLKNRGIQQNFLCVREIEEL